MMKAYGLLAAVLLGSSVGAVAQVLTLPQVPTTAPVFRTIVPAGAVNMGVSAFNAFTNSGPPVYRPGAFQEADGVWQTNNICLRSGDLLLLQGPAASGKQLLNAQQVQRVVVRRDTFEVLRDFAYYVKQKSVRCAAGFVQRVVHQDGYTMYCRWHFDRPGQAEPTPIYLLQRTENAPLETVPQQQRAFQEFMLPLLADNADMAERMKHGQYFYSQTPYVLWQYLQARHLAK
ncbi:hypothetical protein [Hymenobacter sp. CRA2]|uniref:hypothetical protein n=1 Tax=Hymenobacter sp. CRA2 TaxID=1955620 RepID=UPI00098FCBEF|nr:hypothetical protein [Hymenobacter sp. CRA2]OON67468.1 hypothetical protein B0919_18600 [Hymenobacter sp. CRA2]